jgi:putative FmdB family regulatory protein
MYQYHCNSCGYEFDKIKTIENRFWSDPCPKCGGPEDAVTLVVTAGALVTGVGDFIKKMDGGFKDNLKRIKEKNPRSNINIP